MTEAKAGDEGDGILLVYDWECPACDAYCRRVRVAAPAGELRLVNAREASPILAEITDAGLDIDNGMVVKLDGRLYYASEAISVLARLSARTNLFNKLSYALFRAPSMARIVYPVLRACRALLLKALSKTKINNLRIAGNDRF